MGDYTLSTFMRSTQSGDDAGITINNHVFRLEPTTDIEHQEFSDGDLEVIETPKSRRSENQVRQMTINRR